MVPRTFGVVTVFNFEFTKEAQSWIITTTTTTPIITQILVPITPHPTVPAMLMHLVMVDTRVQVRPLAVAMPQVLVPDLAMRLTLNPTRHINR